MSAMIEAPREWVEAVAALRLPPKQDARMQRLMDHNTEGELTAAEREDLEALVELSETLTLVRARGMELLKRKPT